MSLCRVWGCHWTNLRMSGVLALVELCPDITLVVSGAVAFLRIEVMGLPLPLISYPYRLLVTFVVLKLNCLNKMLHGYSNTYYLFRESMTIL